MPTPTVTTLSETLTNSRLGSLSTWTPEQLAAHDREIEQTVQADESRKLQIAVSRLAQQLGKRYSPQLATFDQFVVAHAKQKETVDRLRWIVGRLKEFVTECRGVIFYGPVGTGKDHLLASLLYQVAQAGIACKWVNGQSIFSQFRDSMDMRTSEREVMQEFIAPQVLGISDPIPPVDKTNAWRTELLYRILDARYRELKSTWVTTNAMSPQDADEKLTAPVFDRLRDGAEFFPCFWPSYREMRK